MSSKIIIKLIDNIQAGDTLIIRDSSVTGSDIVIEYETGDNPLTIYGTLETDTTRLKNFINVNHNATGKYRVVADYIEHTVSMSDKLNTSEFSIIENNATPRIETAILNTPPVVSIEILSVSIYENVNNSCGLFNALITTNIQATELISPQIQPVNTLTFLTEGVSRNSLDNINFTVTDGLTTATKGIYIPFTNSDTFKVSVINNPAGNTVTISTKNVFTPEFNYRYSVDNINFYYTNSFTNIGIGSHTIYIQDSLGCSTSVSFEVTEFEGNVINYKPYFLLSEMNSIITVKDEVIDDITIFKNPRNTLSYEEETPINKRDFKQLYKKEDSKIFQQYRSNYENVDIKLIDCKGNESVIIPEKVTANTNITDVRDATVKAVNYLGASYVGLQYKQGNIYDPITLNINGSYNLDNLVPSFIKKGFFIQIRGAGWFEVQEVRFTEDRVQTAILQVSSNNFPFAMGTTSITTTIYDKKNYEVYQFGIDLSNLSGSYKLSYHAYNNILESEKWKSEWFNISDNQRPTYMLSYYNTVNNSMFYASGITNKIRLPDEMRLTQVSLDTQDIVLTSVNAVSVEASYRSTYELELRSVPSTMVKKIGAIVTNDRLFLNGLSLIKNGELQQERIGVTNMYKVTIPFVESDYAYTSNISDSSISLPSSNAIRIGGGKVGIILTNK